MMNEPFRRLGSCLSRKSCARGRGENEGGEMHLALIEVLLQCIER